MLSALMPIELSVRSTNQFKSC